MKTENIIRNIHKGFRSKVLFILSALCFALLLPSCGDREVAFRTISDFIDHKDKITIQNISGFDLPHPAKVKIVYKNREFEKIGKYSETVDHWADQEEKYFPIKYFPGRGMTAHADVTITVRTDSNKKAKVELSPDIPIF